MEASQRDVIDLREYQGPTARAGERNRLQTGSNCPPVSDQPSVHGEINGPQRA
jgi:hypothetical protein